MTKKKALPFLGFPNFPGRSTTKSPHLHRTAFPGTARQGKCGAVQVSHKDKGIFTIILRVFVPWW